MNWPTAICIIFTAPTIFVAVAYINECIKERREEERLRKGFDACNQAKSEPNGANR